MFYKHYLNFSYSVELEDDRKGDRVFTQSSNEIKAWAGEGAELINQYLAREGEYSNL